MSTLFLMILAFAAGLIVGWNFLEQPVRVKEWIAKLRDKF